MSGKTLKNKLYSYLRDRIFIFFDFRKLSSKILYTIISISIVLPTLYSLFFISVVETRVNEYVFDRNESSVLRAKNEIQLFFQTPLSLSKVLSFNSVVANSNILSMNSLFLKTTREHPLIKEISLYNAANGTEIISTQIRDISSRLDTLTYNLIGEKDQLISNVYFDDNNQPFIDIYTKVKRFNRTISVLKSVIDLKYIWNLVDNIKIGKFGSAFLISHDDRLIAHPDKSKVYNKQIMSTFIDKTKPFASKKYVDENNEPIIGTHAKIDLLNWYLVIEQTDEEANSLIRVLQVQSPKMKR